MTIVPIEKWGKDHWSTFIYAERRAADCRGVLCIRNMRCDPLAHPGYTHEGACGDYPTRLVDDSVIERHDDWSCLEDAEHLGLLKMDGVKVELTNTGWVVASMARRRIALNRPYKKLNAAAAMYLRYNAQGDMDNYQRSSLRTWNQARTKRERLLNATLGLGELGEVQNIVKKWAYHGHDLDVGDIADELGDALYYIAIMAHELELKLSTVASMNAEKLRARYPDGFSEERSRDRLDEKE